MYVCESPLNYCILESLGIFQKTPNYTIEKCIPAKKMEKYWKIASKNRKNYYEKAFNICKLNFLPTKIALHQLKIVNHKLKLNSKSKHWLNALEILIEKRKSVQTENIEEKLSKVF